jgi:peptide/nickel transport system substrate-binding protein
MRRAVGLSILIFAVLAASCGPSTAPSGAPSRQSTGSTSPTGPKTVTIAMLGILPAFWDNLAARGGVVPGAGDFKGLASAGLVVLDENDALQPQLGESVPSIENGLWKVLPDGRMEVTFRIREGAKWHDGKPFTAEDLLFTYEVAKDPDVAVFRTPALELIESVEVIDPRTVQVNWRSPYISADAMFGAGSSGARMFAAPLPKHILEATYRENRASITEGPYWTTEFVSNGPFKLREWATDSHVTLDAFPDYVLGRPKLDSIEVRFIPDPSTLLANVLAGTVDLTFSRSVSIEQAAATRDAWREGKMVPEINGWTMMYPQFRVPNPQVLLDPQFRRALMYAINRQDLADTLTAGYAPIADSIISKDLPEYRYVEPSIVKYSYDSTRAAQLIESLGATRGPDGYRDASGQRLSIEIRTTTNDANQKSVAVIADSFQRVGIGAEGVVIPVQRLQDGEYRATFPGLELVNQPNGADGFQNLLHSANAPLPERGFRAPSSSRNRGSYQNPEYDALMDRYSVTIPFAERMGVMAQMIKMQTDLNLVMGLFFSVDAIMMANKLQNVPPASSWNAQLWDLGA